MCVVKDDVLSILCFHFTGFNFCLTGAKVGESDGESVGTTDGVIVGLSVGERDGLNVGV